MSSSSETAPAKTGPSSFKNTIAGGVGGITLVAVGHPLDTIKVRLQTMKIVPGQAPLYTGALDCALKTFRKEGFLGLYKGMSAPLISVTPMYSICFLGYTHGKQLQLKKGQSESDLSLLQIFNAGCLSGVYTTVIMVPGERIKCLLQIQGQEGAEKKYNGPVDCAKKLVREGGLQNLYRGTAATLLRDIPGSGAYFVAYEFFKRRFASEDGKVNVGATLVSGGLAGICNWLVSIPPDVIKSRIQTSPAGTYSGLLDCSRKLIAEEGILSMYRGIGPVMLRAFPANAACFVGYEFAMNILNKFF